MEKINKFMNDSQTYDEFNNDIDKKLKEEDFLGALKICGEAQKIFPDKFDFKFMSFSTVDAETITFDPRLSKI